ncbi:endolytic transglycosylase MltG [Actinoplanes flavus]|uniref:Endolytic murein transglycosylase n=1 Tax=Actinoplanes flavus TaxID=2820290 RepID=A0ABS3UQK5_9ACTN|nr:endolytic transglycosylase MltG [Actinoplanes flavus]MBO3741051.1 endolytic transglycosylase MltG [Actinoplanes flavus]
MIGEIEDLRYEDNPDPGRWRHRKREKGGRSVITFVLVLVLFGVLGGGAWYGYDKVSGFFTAADYDGPGSGEVIVEVKKGEYASAIAETLFKAGVVKSAAAFVEAAKDNPDSTGIQVGSYKLRKQMKASDAVLWLLDRKNLAVNGVVIPEGWTKMQVFAAFSKYTGIPVAEFEKAAKDISKLGVTAEWLKRTDGKKVDKSNIEGFLYPATYEIPKKTTATDVLKLVIKNFNAEMDKLDFAATAKSKLKISPYEALVAASITQVEALLPEDMGPVSRVLYNRAYSGDFPCGCLQLDSTVNYWLRLNGKQGKSSEKLTIDEMHSEDNPYRYNAPGMSIGPISNPGEIALKGAIDAPKSQNFFFVTIDEKGTMAYGKTFDEHNANIKVACKNGIPIC